MHQGPADYKCELCNKYFKKEINYRKHCEVLLKYYFCNRKNHINVLISIVMNVFAQSNYC